MEKKRKKFNTTLRADLIKKLKILAAESDVNVNDLLEDAIEAFLKKHEKKANNWQDIRTWYKQYKILGLIIKLKV